MKHIGMKKMWQNSEKKKSFRKAHRFQNNSACAEAFILF